MKPFDLEKAKAGDPVQTRDGRKARILCFDMKNSDNPIVAIVTNDDGTENVYSFTKNGTYYDFDNKHSIYLVMDNKAVTKFANVYKDRVSQEIFIGNPFDSIEDAQEAAKDSEAIFIYTQVLSWEE